VSLCVDPGFFLKRLGAGGAPSAAVHDLIGLTERCHEMLVGAPLEAQAKAYLGELLATSDAEAKHVSFMLPRRGTLLKLDIRLETARFGAYLDHIGWPAPIMAIERRVRELVPWDGHLQLNLVVDRDSTSKLEVEVFAGNVEAGPPARTRFLEQLVDANMCSREKAEFLGSISHRSVDHRSGLALAKSWYAKLRFAGDILVDAKAYVGIMPRLFISSPGMPGANRIGQA
jgi:hypothetical protein